MKLYLLRHGIASASNSKQSTDAFRILTDQGREKMSVIANALGRLDLGIDQIWSSPYTRTRETSAIIVEKLAIGNEVRLHRDLEPKGNLRRLVDDIAEVDPEVTSLMLVGHEPGLSMLISVLSTGTPNLRTDFKKGGIAKLELDGRIAFERSATLNWLLPPRLLVMLAR